MTFGVRHIALGVLLLALMGASSAQDLILTGNIVNNGTINVNRNVINNAATPVTVGGTGLVRLAGNVGAITAHSIQGNDSISFYRLDLRGNRPTTLLVGVIVWNQLRIGYPANPYTAAGTGFSIGTRTLALNNLSSYDPASTSALTFTGGTVRFFGTAPQSILNIAPGIAYGTLDLTGAGTKSPAAGGTVTAASLTQNGGALIVTENIDVTGSLTAGAISDIAVTKALQLTAASTNGSISSFSNSSGGALRNAGAGTLTIAALAGNAGTIDQSGTGRTSFAGNIVNTGTITTGVGTLDLQGGGTQVNTGGTISVTDAGNAEIAGDLATNSGTLTFDAASTARYDGASQNLPIGVTYGNFIAGGTAPKSSGGSFTVAGTLTLDQNVTMNAGALTLTSMTAANVFGPGEVIGSVRRTHDFAAGQNYRFNRSDVFIGTAATPATDLTLTMHPGIDPSGTLPSNQYARRQYALTPTAAGSLQSLQLAYAVGELQNGVNEGKLGLRSYNGAWSKVTNAGHARIAGGGRVTYTGLNNPLAGLQELGLFRIDFVTRQNGANISLASGWDENALPDVTDDALVNHAGVITGASPVAVRTLTIAAAGDLATNGTSGITVADSTFVLGSLNITNADASVGGLWLQGTATLGISAGRTMSGAEFVNTSSTAMTIAGDLQMTSLQNSASSALTLNGAATAFIDSAVNLGSLVIGGAVRFATAAPQLVRNSGTITLNTAASLLRVGQAGIASTLRIEGSGRLRLTNPSARAEVAGNVEVMETGIVNNDGTIVVGE